MRNLQLKNTAFYKNRNTGIVVTTAIFTFLLFVSSMVLDSIQAGITSAGERLGADIMVVPRDYEGAFAEVLLRSEPCTFYFEKDEQSELEALDEIEQVSAQLYIESLDASCCSLPVQIIGVDFSKDFVIAPWISAGNHKAPGEGEVVIGYLVEAQPGDSIVLYGVEFPVAARLAQTGTGFDSSVFMTRKTAECMIEYSAQTAERPAGLQTGSVSCYMVDIKKGEDYETAAEKIRSRIPEADVIAANQLVGGLFHTFHIVKTMVFLAIAFLWMTALIVLGVIFHISILERKRELGLYRLLGYQKGMLAELLVSEASLLSTAGGICGLSAGCMIVFPFKNLIAASLELPYMSLSARTIAASAFICICLTAITGISACMLAFCRVGRAEDFLLIKEEL